MAEIRDDYGTEDTELVTMDDTLVDHPDAPGLDDTPTATSGTQPATQEQQQEQLIDPATLPPELKPHWSRMTSAYNKRLGELRKEQANLETYRTKAQMVDRFYTDPAYRQQVLLDVQRQYGGAPQAAPAAPAPPQGGPAADIPPQVLQAVDAALADSPDLKFLAPAIAKAAYAVAQQQVQPLQQAREQEYVQRLQQEYESMVQSFAERQPGWEEHETDMADLTTFLRGAFTRNGPLQHPKFGNVLEVLYNVVTGNKYATATAGRRMAQALSSRTSVGNGAQTPAPDVRQQIAKTTSAQDKWQLAMRAALQEIQRGA